MVRCADDLYEIQTELNSKITKIKEIIGKITYIPPHLQRLSFIRAGVIVILQSSTRLSLYALEDGHEITLEEVNHT